MSSSALDIRLRIDYWDHPKTLKLIRRTGVDGAIALQRVWFWCRHSCHSGVFDDQEEIELVGKWAGEPGIFAAALLDVGFLDRLEDGWGIRNWEDHQPWLRESIAKAEAGRKGAKAMWEKRRSQEFEMAESKHCHSSAIAKPMAETRRDESKKIPPNPPEGGDGLKAKNQVPKIDREICRLWNEIVAPHGPKPVHDPEIPPKSLQRNLPLRRKEHPRREDPGYWRETFQKILRSPFLLGKTSTRPRPFDLPELCAHSRVLEGLDADRYEDQQSQAQAPPKHSRALNGIDQIARMYDHLRDEPPNTPRRIRDESDE